MKQDNAVQFPTLGNSPALWVLYIFKKGSNYRFRPNSTTQTWTRENMSY